MGLLIVVLRYGLFWEVRIIVVVLINEPETLFSV